MSTVPLLCETSQFTYHFLIQKWRARYFFIKKCCFCFFLSKMSLSHFLIRSYEAHYISIQKLRILYFFRIQLFKTFNLATVSFKVGKLATFSFKLIQCATFLFTARKNYFWIRTVKFKIWVWIDRYKPLYKQPLRSGVIEGGLAPPLCSLLMCPFLLMSPLNVLFL